MFYNFYKNRVKDKTSKSPQLNIPRFQQDSGRAHTESRGS
jgi:hypothetical protein